MPPTQSMKRLVFLNRFFFPDHSATSRNLTDLAFHLAGCGADVHVIASQQLYDNPRAELPRTQIVNGVQVHRVPTTAFGRSALIGRGIDYASYYFSMWRCARALVGQGDIVIAKTDPPLTSVVAMRVAGQTNAGLVNWLQDIYPEAAVELGIPFVRGPLGQGLCRLRDLSLRKAAANVVLGTQMAQRVRSRGVPGDRVHVIPNWSDDEQLCPVPHEENPLRREWGLQENFVAGYSGNLGRAHEFETVLAAAELLRDHPRIMFLFVGGGHHFELLAAEYPRPRPATDIPFHSLSGPGVAEAFAERAGRASDLATTRARRFDRSKQIFRDRGCRASGNLGDGKGGRDRPPRAAAWLRPGG